ncbi:MAG: SOS response-associated peptidase [Pseudomonadota bacterium]
MPGRLILTTPVAEIAAASGASVGELEESPRRNIKPGEEIVVLGAGPVLRRMRWGLIPSGRVNARGRPVLETIVNARSETVFDKSAFVGVTRCVVPADGWYEWTGAKGRKSAWRIGPSTRGLLWFAAICDPWIAPGGREIWQVATVTCPPNGDVRDIHDRMGVLLDIKDIPAWLDGDEETARALMRPLPEGELTVEAAEGVDWSAP